MEVLCYPQTTAFQTSIGRAAHCKMDPMMHVLARRKMQDVVVDHPSQSEIQFSWERADLIIIAQTVDSTFSKHAMKN